MTTSIEKSLLSILLAGVLVGCTSTTHFTLPEDHAALTQEVMAGDQVQIAIRDGSIREITVTELSGSGVCGVDTCYDYRELESITVETISWFKTSAATVGSLLAITAAAAASIGSVL